MRGSRDGGKGRQTARARHGLTLLLIALAGLALSPGRAPATGPAIQTDSLRAGSLVFVFRADQRAAARALARSIGRPDLPGLPADVLEDRDVIIFLAPDPEAFDTLAPGSPDWAAGVAFPEGNRIVLPAFAADSRPLATILLHELAHIALRRYLGGGVPRWFHEGYAQLAARSWSASEAWKLRLAIAAGSVPDLESLSLDFPRGRVSAEHAYLLAYTAVEEMYGIGGPEGFGGLLARWRVEGELDRALRLTYGITLGQFERIWRSEVRNRFGWLLVLSQAVVFWSFLAILLLGMGYWSLRRRARKLEHMRAREAAADRAGFGEGPGTPGSGSEMIDVDP